jgi:hypothetical protein
LLTAGAARDRDQVAAQAGARAGGAVVDGDAGAPGACFAAQAIAFDAVEAIDLHVVAAAACAVVVDAAVRGGANQAAARAGNVDAVRERAEPFVDANVTVVIDIVAYLGPTRRAKSVAVDSVTWASHLPAPHAGANCPRGWAVRLRCYSRMQTAESGWLRTR